MGSGRQVRVGYTRTNKVMLCFITFRLLLIKWLSFHNLPSWFNAPLHTFSLFNVLCHPFFSLYCLWLHASSPLLHLYSVLFSFLTIFGSNLFPPSFSIGFGLINFWLWLWLFNSFQGFLLSIKSVYTPFIYTGVRYCIHFTLCFSQWAKENVIQVIPQIL